MEIYQVNSEEFVNEDEIYQRLDELETFRRLGCKSKTLNEAIDKVITAYQELHAAALREGICR